MLLTDCFVQDLDEADLLPELAHGIPALTLALLMTSLRSGTDVAYLPTLSFDTALTVYGHLSSAERHTILAKAACGPMQKWADQIARQCISRLPPPSGPTPITAAVAAALAQLPSQLGSWRLALGVTACAQACAGRKTTGCPTWSYPGRVEDLWLGDLWLGHLVLMGAMTVQHRMLARVSSLSFDSVAGQFVSKVLDGVGGMVQGMAKSGGDCGYNSSGSGSNGDSCWGPERVDPYDLGLFTTLAALVCEVLHSGPAALSTLALPEPVVAQWEAARAALRSTLAAMDCRLPAAPPLSPYLSQATPQVAASFPLNAAATAILKEACRASHEGPTGAGLDHDHCKTGADIHPPQAHLLPHPPLGGPIVPMESQRPNLEPGFVTDVLSQCGMGSFTAHMVDPSQGKGVSPPGQPVPPPSSAPFFCIATPFVEKYHWHCRRQLEPAYMKEAGPG